MKKEVYALGKQQSHVDYKPFRPFMQAPKILKEYMDGDTRMYLCEGKRVFDANTYDKNFGVVKGKILDRHARDKIKMVDQVIKNIGPLNNAKARRR